MKYWQQDGRQESLQSVVFFHGSEGSVCCIKTVLFSFFVCVEYSGGYIPGNKWSLKDTVQT